MKFLIIEDSSGFRLILKKTLRAVIPGVQISQAVNGKSALLMIASETAFDCIILDLSLPDLGGLEILEICNNLALKCPIVTISDTRNEKTLKASLKIGAAAYLTKPISKKQLEGVFLEKLSFSNVAVVPKVLIVDDDKINRRLLRSSLEKSSFDCDEASNGFEAIRYTRHQYYSCILMDRKMPFMNGTDAARTIIRELPHTPIVFLISDEDALSHEERSFAGFGFLKKPIQKQDLLKIVNDALDSAGLHIGKAIKRRKVPVARKQSDFPIFEDFLKFVPQNFISHNELNHNMKRGLSRVESLSVVFIDIRKYTEMTEDMTSAECFKFINSYFEMIEPIVHNFGGNVYQFLGDGVLCTFPLHKGSYSGNAVHAAISIQDQITIYNRGRIRAGYEPITIGCGISTGEIAIGICGSDTRYEIGAFGSTMNLAARSQSACRDFGIGITITSQTYLSLEDPDLFPIRPIGAHKLKGIKEKVPLYEVFSHNHPTLRNQKSDCARYIKKIQQQKQNDHLPVAELVQEFPDDPLWRQLAEQKEGVEIY